MGVSHRLDGEAGSTIKLSYILESYLYHGHALCTLLSRRFHSPLDFTETICLDSVRNIDESTSKINTQLVWGSP